MSAAVVRLRAALAAHQANPYPTEFVQVAEADLTAVLMELEGYGYTADKGRSYARTSREWRGNKSHRMTTMTDDDTQQ